MLGIAIASYRDHGGVDRFLVLPGDDVQITFPTAGVHAGQTVRVGSRSSISTKAR